MEGHVHPEFAAVAEALRSQVGRCPGGAATCVYHRGERVVDIWGGIRDEAGTPWTEDTMAPSFSTTKGAASTVMHVLVDRGLLDYDDLVSQHWPEFAQAGKEKTTVRHVMAHQSGLYHLRQMLDHAERMLDWDHVIRAIEQSPPAHPPGQRTGYHGLSYGFLVGEIIQRVTRKSFSHVVQEELAKPLDLDGMYIGAPDEVLDRAARLITPEGGLRLAGFEWVERAAVWLERALGAFGIEAPVTGIFDLAPRGFTSMDFSANATLRVAMPSMNGLFTARSLARMYAALAGGGAVGGVRLLSPETLLRATDVQPSARHAYFWPVDMRWRLGYHRIFTTRGGLKQAFGHFGFGGSGAWADPSRELAVGLIVNSGAGTPFGDMRIAQIGARAVSCADSRR